MLWENPETLSCACIHFIAPAVFIHVNFLMRGLTALNFGFDHRVGHLASRTDPDNP